MNSSAQNNGHLKYNIESDRKEGTLIILLTTKIICFMITTSSYPAIFANRISSSNGLIGKPVRVWDNPVTVIVSKLHDVTEA